MGKVIFGLLIAAIIWLLFIFKRKSDLRDSSNDATLGKKAPPTAPDTAAIENIVKCARCGVNIVESESTTTSSGDVVCMNASQCSSRN